jgi:hypothetical protein
VSFRYRILVNETVRHERNVSHVKAFCFTTRESVKPFVNSHTLLWRENTTTPRRKRSDPKLAVSEVKKNAISFLVNAKRICTGKICVYVIQVPLHVIARSFVRRSEEALLERECGGKLFFVPVTYCHRTLPYFRRVGDTTIALCMGNLTSVATASSIFHKIIFLPGTDFNNGGFKSSDGSQL